MTAGYLIGDISPIPGIGGPPGATCTPGTLLNLQAGHAAGTGKWNPVPVQQPCILYPLYGPDNPGTPWATTNQGAGGLTIADFNPRFLYVFKEPQDDNEDPDINGVFQVSVQGGICFLDKPGVWWVWNPSDLIACPFVLVPCHDNAQAERFLMGLSPNEPISVLDDLAANGTGVGADALLLGWDIKRRGWAVTNNSGKTMNIWLGRSAVTAIQPLAAGQTMVCGMDGAPHAPVLGEAASGAAVVNGLTVTTWRV